MRRGTHRKRGIGNRLLGLARSARGQVLAIAALVLPVMLGMGALSVDVGFLYSAKTALQTAVDAAAMAGASGLSAGNTTAQSRATQFAQANQVAGKPVTLQSSDIEFGTYNTQSGAFTPGGATPNAIRVTGRMNVPLFFAAAIGFSNANITAQAIAGVRSAATCGALFADQRLTMSGNANTDSYNSSQGAYNAATAGSNGSVCSNGGIIMSGQALVRGNGTPGPGMAVDMSGQANVTGATTAASTAFSVPSVSVGNAATVNNNGSIGLTSSGKNPVSSSPDFSMSGQDTITLNSGTYYFQSFSISGQAQVNINANNGPVTIYVTNSISVSGGGIVNLSAVPANFRILVTGSSASFSGNSDFHGVVVAPAAQLSLSGASHFFGSVIAREGSVSGMGQGGFHYDEALANTDIPQITTPAQPFLGG